MIPHNAMVDHIRHELRVMVNDVACNFDADHKGWRVKFDDFRTYWDGNNIEVNLKGYFLLNDKKSPNFGVSFIVAHVPDFNALIYTKPVFDNLLHEVYGLFEQFCMSGVHISVTYQE